MKYAISAGADGTGEQDFYILITRMKGRFFLFVSLAVDILIAGFKFVATAVTGSSSMASEGIHSVIDAVSQLLLIWGTKSSKKLPDAERPFGYGKELYFWSFVVSLIIFSVGGCLSIYQGILRFKRPPFEGSPVWNYAVLAFAFVFNLISLFAALKVFNRQRRDTPFVKALVRTKDPTTIIVILGDIGDLMALVIAFLGVYLSRLYHNPHFDGIASIIIGALLVAVSAFLLKESKSLLMGEPTSKKTLDRVVAITEADSSISKVSKSYSTHLSPDEIVLEMNVVFNEDLDTNQITSAIDRVTDGIKTEFPSTKQIFIQPVVNEAKKGSEFNSKREETQ
jgi:cation diffusion facilitator family transporter